ncbi:MAG: ROK family protein [Gammaproteobacteria bacterium]|nr:ROK family protein [Gammaproteobacteria bacterium]MBU1644912.1 ROK family protein [Gammaproteobacteria bacterium]MBU1971371.1 ROK family protein [Gammaproteobacteria bacterium]
MRLGIDLGGSKIEIVALGDGGNGDAAELLRERVATPQGDYAATLAAIAGLVAATEQKLGAGGTAASVGIGIPGAESKATGLIKNANSTCLIGQPLRRDLEAALGRPLRLANDANCFALSEATDGAAAGAAVVFGVILGTGVGGGIVIDGKVLNGANAIAGEWGHNPMPGEHHRPLCYCGRKGCIELYLSGPGMAKEHRRTAIADFSPQQIVAQAAAGDADCEASLQLYETRLARALATVINVVDPDVIVLGGGLSNIDRLYASVPKLWGAFVFSDRVDTRLVKARFGDSSGVRGAAWLW